MRTPYAASLLLVSIQICGCSRGGPSLPEFTVRDSADLQIVESVAPLWEEGGGWRVEATPDLDLSEAADETLSRVSGAKLLPDGRLVLFNGGRCELRISDDGDSLRTTFGRCGEGPGEFQRVQGIWPWPGDSLLVVDQSPNRVSVFDAGGTLGRTGRVLGNSDLPLPFVVGVLKAGTLVLTGSRDPVGRSTPGVESSAVVLAMAAGPDEPLQILGSFSGPVWEYTDLGGRLGRGRLAFSSSTQFAVGADRVWVGFPDRYEIRVFDARGHLQQIIRRTFAPVTVTSADIDWLLQRRLGEVEGAENQRLVRQAFRELRHAEVMPAFGVPVWPGGAEGGPPMLVDAVGDLWVFEHYRPGQYANRWAVFSAEGAWSGIVTLPDRLVPTQIGVDFVLGQWEDDLGFLHVRRHRLLKP